MRMLAAVLVLALAGCAGINGGPNMSVDQLKAIAADKNASVVCSTIMGPWGTGKVVLVNMDQRVITDGGVAVSPDCTIKIENSVPPKVVTPAPVAAPKVQ